MIVDVVASELKERAAEMLADLDAPPWWLEDAIEDYNCSPRDADGQPTIRRPLLIQLLQDRVHLESILAPAVRRLVRHYKSLSEFTARGWTDRQARILGKDFGAFHSTLAEIALHEWLASRPNVWVRLIDPESSGPRPDFEIRFGEFCARAELKSVLSEDVRMPEGAHLGGFAVDHQTAQAVWRRFRKAIRKGQVGSGRPSLVFVDVSACDELSIFLTLPREIPAMKPHAESLLDSLASAACESAPEQVGLMVCAFEPYSFRVRFVAPVSDRDT